MKFFKPNLLKIILFVIFVLISFFLIQNAWIFTCKTQPVVLNPPGYQKDMCLPPLFAEQLIGISIIYSQLAYVLHFTLLIILPYLVACFIAFLFDRT